MTVSGAADMDDSCRPTLFFGVGGSGGKLVDALCARLEDGPHIARAGSRVQCLVLDTAHADLDALHSVPRERRVLLPSFDHALYAAAKRGERSDPSTTAWMHEDYRFDNDNARVDLRLALQYGLELDRAGLAAALGRALERCTAADRPDRVVADRAVDVVLCGSLVGATSSAMLLLLGCWLQDRAVAQGWSARVVCVALLPSLFRSAEGTHGATFASRAYASLKEIEHAMRLARTEGPASLTVNHDRDHPERIEIFPRPFACCHLVDLPGGVPAPRALAGLASALVLRTLSSRARSHLDAAQREDAADDVQSDPDGLAHYSTLGGARLIFPRAALLHYAGLRFCAWGMSKLAGHSSAMRDVLREAIARDELEADALLSDPPGTVRNATASMPDDCSEVLRDDDAARRLWDLFYDDYLAGALQWGTAELQTAVRAAQGVLDPQQAAQRAHAVLYVLGKELASKALLGEPPMNLSAALWMEARYVALGPRCAELDSDERRAAWAALTGPALVQQVRAKLARASSAARVLARFIPDFNPGAEGPEGRLCIAVHSQHVLEAPGSLAAGLRELGGDLDHEWPDPDTILFARGLHRIPIRALACLRAELADSYERERDERSRTYPLHIDQRWETALPDL